MKYPFLLSVFLYVAIVVLSGISGLSIDWDRKLVENVKVLIINYSVFLVSKFRPPWFETGQVKSLQYIEPKSRVLVTFFIALQNSF